MRSVSLERNMPDPSESMLLYVRKLERGIPLSEEAKVAFMALKTKVFYHETYRDIVSEGEHTKRCCLLSSGFVSRYKTLANGGRQINSFHIPGDMIDLPASLIRVSDHGIRTHTASDVVTFDSDEILELAERYPEWGRAFWFDTLVDSAIFREWTLNIGRRTATARVAHLMLELAWRMAAIGMSDGRTFVLPVTQTDLADAVGLSPVHTNRTLQSLREAGMIRTFSRTVIIEDRERMVQESEFDDAYLHPQGPGWRGRQGSEVERVHLPE